VGEISVSNSSRHVLEFGNVKVLNDCIELALSSSKTDQTLTEISPTLKNP
jgi:hypothetical protein